MSLARLMTIVTLFVILSSGSSRAEKLFPFRSDRARRLIAHIERFTADPDIPIEDSLEPVMVAEDSVERTFVLPSAAPCTCSECVQPQRRRPGRLFRMRQHLIDKTYRCRLKHQEWCNCLHGASYYEPLVPSRHSSYGYHATEWRPFPEDCSYFPMHHRICDSLQTAVPVESSSSSLPLISTDPWLSTDEASVERFADPSELPAADLPVPSWDAEILDKPLMIGPPVLREPRFPGTVPGFEEFPHPLETAAQNERQVLDPIEHTVQPKDPVAFDGGGGPYQEEYQDAFFELPVRVKDEAAAD